MATAAFTITGDNWQDADKISELCRALSEREKAVNNKFYKWHGNRWWLGSSDGTDNDVDAGTDIQNLDLYYMPDELGGIGQIDGVIDSIVGLQSWCETRCGYFLPPDALDYSNLLPSAIQTIGELGAAAVTVGTYTSVWEYFCKDVAGEGPLYDVQTGEYGWRRSTDGETVAARGNMVDGDCITRFVFEDFVAVFNELMVLRESSSFYFYEEGSRASGDSDSLDDTSRAIAIASAEAAWAGQDIAAGNITASSVRQSTWLRKNYTEATGEWDYSAKGFSSLGYPWADVTSPVDVSVAFYALADTVDESDYPNAVLPLADAYNWDSNGSGLNRGVLNLLGNAASAVATSFKRTVMMTTPLGALTVGNWPEEPSVELDTWRGYWCEAYAAVVVHHFSNGATDLALPETDYTSGSSAGYADGLADGVAGNATGTSYDDGSPTSTSSYQSGYAVGYAEGFAAGEASYDSDYAAGETAGETAGYSDGYGNEAYDDAATGSVGYVAGFEAGYSTGYSSGSDDYDAEYADGLADGYAAGLANDYDPPETMTDPYEDGYEDGYDDGIASYQADWDDGYADGLLDGFSGNPYDDSGGDSAGYIDGYSSGYSDGGN
jgi:hypothetical protein